jgi:hypothetical protein
MTEIIDFKSRTKHLAEPDQTVVEFLKDIIEKKWLDGAVSVLVVTMDEAGVVELYATQNLAPMEQLWMAEIAKQDAVAPEEEDE